jgi:hypothetical protein
MLSAIGWTYAIRFLKSDRKPGVPGVHFIALCAVHIESLNQMLPVAVREKGNGEIYHPGNFTTNPLPDKIEDGIKVFPAMFVNA